MERTMSYRSKKITINWEKKRAYQDYGGGEIRRKRFFFFKGWYMKAVFVNPVFENGLILASYSFTPPFSVYPQERGWVLINPKTSQIIAEVKTYDRGSTGKGTAELKEWRQKYGKLSIFRDASGKQLHRVND